MQRAPDSQASLDVIFNYSLFDHAHITKNVGSKLTWRTQARNENSILEENLRIKLNMLKFSILIQKSNGYRGIQDVYIFLFS